MSLIKRIDVQNLRQTEWEISKGVLAAGAFCMPLAELQETTFKDFVKGPLTDPPRIRHPIRIHFRWKSTWILPGGRAGGGINKTINLLWASVAAVVAVAIHSTPVPQTYPLCPQHSQRP